MRSMFLLSVIQLFTVGITFAGEGLQPFIYAYTTSGEIGDVAQNVASDLKNAGFEVLNIYEPYEGVRIIVVTSEKLKSAARSSEFGGYVAAQRVSVTKSRCKKPTVGNPQGIEVSYTNPLYWGNAYRVKAIGYLEEVDTALEETLGKKQEFGAGEKHLTAKDLRKYHYMFGMEYFDDPSELAEQDSYDEAVAAVEKGLAEGRGGVSKVYRIDIPGKDETVFGVALTDAGCSGDEYIMGRVDTECPRSSAHLPYEILVSDGDVYAQYARFRIAISFPHLRMFQSETGATFFNIMCAPNAIEEALTEAAGGEP